MSIQAAAAYPVNDNSANEINWAHLGKLRGDTGIFRQGFQGTITPTTPSASLTVNIEPFDVLVEAIAGEFPSSSQLTFGTAHATFDRYDRIVASLYKDVSPYEIHLEVLPGTASSVPVLPSLRNSATRHDVSIGYALVEAGSIAVTSAKITMDREWCATQETEWKPYSPVASVYPGASHSISSQSLVGKYRFSGPNCQVSVAGGITLGGSVGGGLLITLPIAARATDVDLRSHAFDTVPVAYTTAHPGGGLIVYARLFPITLQNGFPEGVGAFPLGASYTVTLNGEYETVR